MAEEQRTLIPIYIDLEGFVSIGQIEDQVTTLIGIGRWFGEQQIMTEPTLIAYPFGSASPGRSRGHLFLRCEVRKDEAVAIRLRFPTKTQAQIDKMHDDYEIHRASVNALVQSQAAVGVARGGIQPRGGYISTSSIQANTIQASQIKVNKSP